MTPNTPGTIQSRNRKQLLVILWFLTVVSIVIVELQRHFGYTVSVQTISAILFLVYAFFTLKFDTFFFLLMFLLMFSIVGVMLSTLMIENGAFMIEIGQQGYCTGATARFVAFSMLLVSSAYTVYSNLLPRIKWDRKPGYEALNGLNRLLVVGLLAIYIVILVYLISITLIWGSPLLMGLNRVDYWNVIAPPFTRYLVSLLPQLNLLLGVAYIADGVPVKKKWIFVIFCLVVGVQLLQGEKFSGLILSIYFFFLPTLMGNFKHKNFEINYKLLFRALAALSIMVGVVLYNYRQLGGSFKFAAMMLADRVALQGQVWWAIDEGHAGMKSASYIIKHLMGIGAAEYEKGLYFLMYLISPEDTFLTYFVAGGTFTGGFPAILIVGFGYLVSAFVTIGCGLLLGWVVINLYEYILRRDFFVLFVSVKLFFATYFSLSMGSVDLYFTEKYFIFLLICISFKYFSLKIR